MSAERLHVVFSDSAAGVVKQAIAKLGGARNNVLAPSPRCAQVGPLGMLPKSAERHRWLKENTPELLTILSMGTTPAEWIQQDQAFWDRLSEWQGPSTIWISSRSAENLSYLAICHQQILNKDQVELIDVCKIQRAGSPILSVGECTLQMIREAAESVATRSLELIETTNVRVEAFSAPDACLRVIENDEMINAPIDHYDKFIVSRLSDKWAHVRRLFADIFIQQCGLSAQNIEYYFLISRIHALTNDGVIERRGESSKPLFVEDPLMGEIRLKQI